MKRTITVSENRFRSGTSSFNKDTGMVRLSFSSDAEILCRDAKTREAYYEVLDHSEHGMDKSRLSAGTSLCFNHDTDILLGRNTFVGVDGGRGYVDSKISEAEDVKSYRTKIEEGILCDTSVGYKLLDGGEETGERGGIPIVKFRWLPYEVSMVTVPADLSVGMGRSAPDDGKEKLIEISVSTKETVDTPIKSDTPTTNLMADPIAPVEEPKLKIDVVKERAEAGTNALANYEKKRDAIEGWIAKLPKEGWREEAKKIAAPFLKVSDTRTFGDFQAEAVIACEAKLLDTPQEGTKLGMGKSDMRKWSLRKLILESHKGEVTGLEKEVAEAGARLYGAGKDGRSFSGYCVPHDIADLRVDETFDLDQRGMVNLMADVQRQNAQLGRALSASTFGSGGFLVQTDLLAGSFIDILRNACLIGQGPFACVELGGLQGNIAIPKQLTTGTVYWLAEGASVTESSLTGGQLYFTPHRMGCQTNWTKQLLLQASLSVEMLVRSDIAQLMGIEEDRVSWTGSGASGEPLGIMNTTGVGADVTFSGAAVWADLINFEYYIENANVRTGQLVFATTPLTKSYLKQTLKVAASTFPFYLWEKNQGFPNISNVMPGSMNEYPAYATKQIPSNLVVFGVFNSNFVKARWGGLDVVTDPYTGAASETIKTYVNQWIDTGLRYPQAFEVSVDAPTAP
jgi:HK97 family phage major capsid protein